MNGHFDQSNENAAGFSLVEMLAIIALLATIAAIALPAMRGQPDRLRFEVTVNRIMDAIRLTRTMAIATNSISDLEFDLDKKIFQSKAVAPAVVPNEITLKLKVAALSGTTYSSGKIKFFPDGSSSGAEIMLSMRSMSTTICLNWITGIAREALQCRSL